MGNMKDAAEDRAVTMKRNKNAAVLYTRILGWQQSVGRERVENLPDGVCEAVQAGVARIIADVEKRLPASVKALATG